ncbi:MAG: right-handed parallel beta-helix repeat-containing protein [Myxococcota bacterium]
MAKTSRCGAALVAVAGLLATATAAWASDGVVEINHTCAVQTGCFGNDFPGYPVTINGSAGRSYRLTSDLVVPGENTDGILVFTSDVGIDLANFTIIRSGCVGATTDCTPTTGGGSGINVTDGDLVRGTSVRNGSITGMGRYGVLLGPQSEIRDLRVRWNRIGGVFAATASTITGITAYQNGGSGIFAGNGGSTVTGNTAYLNGTNGIQAVVASTLSGNTAYLNGGAGLFAGSGANVSGNTTHDNAGSGIEAGDGSVLDGNVARNNGATGMFLGAGVSVRGSTSAGNTGDGIFTSSGATVTDNTVYGNGGDGIQAGTDSLVHRNAARLNAGYGLQLSGGTGFRENVVNDNTTGTVLSGVNLGNNVCNGNTTCP